MNAPRASSLTGCVPARCRTPRGIALATGRLPSSAWLAPLALALCASLPAGGAAAQGAEQPVQGRYAMALPLHPASAAGQPQAGTQAITPLRARTLFRLYCSGCHQADGSGSPAFGVPSMRGTLGYFQRTPMGRAFLVQAPGARNAHVTDAELAALTNWALNEFSAQTLPGDFKPYTTEEVSRWRANPPLDVAGTRAAIAAGFPK